MNNEHTNKRAGRMANIKWLPLKESEFLEFKQRVCGDGRHGTGVVGLHLFLSGFGIFLYTGPTELEIANTDQEPMQCNGCDEPKVISAGQEFLCQSADRVTGVVAAIYHKDRDVAIAAHNAAVRVINEAEGEG